MEQLSGMDSAFLYMETAKTPMHIGGIAIYDPSTAPNGFVRFKDILKFIEERLHLAKSFRRKVVTPPLNIDYPYWVEDSDFDLEYHVRHIALPQPGDWRQLCIQAARLHSRMLDLKKPLWEFTVVEGLNKIPGVPKGSYAIISKIHHAAIDGVSGVDIATALHSPSPETAIAPPEKPWLPERTPSSLELIARAQLNTVALPLRFGRQVAKTLPGLGRLVQGIARGTLRSGFGSVPRTRFNGSVGSHRVVGGCDFDLATMKEMRLKIPGATVNDVVVAIVGGAMRNYLKGKSELPSESMVAMAPISVRTPGEKNTLGNQVSAMTIPIGTHIADPIARLTFVHDEAEASKALTKAVGARELSDYSKFTPSMLTGLAARLYVGLGMANRVAPMFNTVITNIPGPPVPLYMNGARLVTQFGLGPVFEGMGIIHPVFSNFGRITISFTSDRDIMPDPEHYQECIQESFEEMKAATLGKPRERASTETKKRSRKKKVSLATVDGTKVDDAA